MNHFLYKYIEILNLFFLKKKETAHEETLIYTKLNKKEEEVVTCRNLLWGCSLTTAWTWQCGDYDIHEIHIWYDAWITRHSWHSFWHSFTCYYVRMHGSESAIPSRDQLVQFCCPTSQQQNSFQSVGQEDWQRIGVKTQTLTRKFNVTWQQIRRAPHWARASLHLVCRERNLSVLSGINIHPTPPPF